MYSGVKKTIRNTSSNGGGRRHSEKRKKRRGGSDIKNKGAARGEGGSNVNTKGPKAKPVSNGVRKGSDAIGDKDPGKRPRSASLHGLPPNSQDNPINVDDFLSMFEPAILNEYVCFISFQSCSS